MPKTMMLYSALSSLSWASFALAHNSTAISHARADRGSACHLSTASFHTLSFFVKLPWNPVRLLFSFLYLSLSSTCSPWSMPASLPRSSGENATGAILVPSPVVASEMTDQKFGEESVDEMTRPALPQLWREFGVTCDIQGRKVCSTLGAVCGSNASQVDPKTSGSQEQDAYKTEEVEGRGRTI